MVVERFLFAAIGLAIGSFGNVLIYRIKSGGNIFGRSHCPACHRSLSWYELFPVVSFLILNGRCRTCRHKISIRYPLVEVGSMCLFLFALFLHPESGTVAFFTGVLLTFLFFACVFDASYQQVPDFFTIIIGLMALVLVLLQHSIVTGVIGAAVMLAWFGGQWLMSRGTWVGTGDIFLAVALGFWLGWPQALILLILSYMVGAVVVVVLLAFKKISSHQKRIAFVPFLGIGTLLTILGVGDFYVSLF